MSTSSKKILFETDLGSEITITSGYMAVYQITGDTPTVVKSSFLTQTSTELEFDVDSEAYYYAVARIDAYQKGSNTPVKIDGEARGFSLLSVFNGQQEKVSIGARSTVASAFAFNKMMTLPQNIYIAETPGTSVAYGMKNNFIKDDGTLSEVISNSPNALETNSYPMFNYLSALVYYCSINDDIYARFLDKTTHDSYKMMGGLLHLIQHPFDNVADIYDLISDDPEVFSPSLKTMKLSHIPGKQRSPIPNQWTLTIKVNRSGADNFLMSGLAYIVFDKDNKAWITNNFRAGTPNSGTHCMVLYPDGKPVEFSPLTGGGLLGTGFGAAVNPAGDRIAIGSYGWGPKEYNPQFGSVAVFSSDGEVKCPSNGFTPLLSRVQGMCYDSKGNLWMASVGMQNPMAPGTPSPVFNFADADSAVVVYPGGTPEGAKAYHNFLDAPSPYHGTFDVAIDSEDNIYVANMGHNDADKNPSPVSSVYKFAYQNGEIVKLAHWQSSTNESLRQIWVHPSGEVLVGSIVENRIIRLKSDDLTEITPSYTDKVNSPWA
ncbi:hypothetical protein [Flavobacterium sp. 3HN19-14]|uniref:hypothetical protein n=1 Tax=Flavobacterium sp. 3HN19-14 TaxID=3448133 RepID=UPI003EE41D58